MCPFEFGFLLKPSKPLAILDNIVNGIFAIDIILTFFVAYLDKASYLLIDNPKLIAWRYTRTWLAFDVISSIPYEATEKILPSPLQSYGYFNILRLWRLRRVSKLFARWDIISLLLFSFTIVIDQTFLLMIFMTDWRRTRTIIMFGFDT